VPIVPPIIYAEGLDLTFYATQDDLTWDVGEGLLEGLDYVAFDAEGRRLELTGDEGLVEVRALEDEPTGAGDLDALLRRWLDAVAVEPDGRPLVEVAVEHGGLIGPGTSRRFPVWRFAGAAFLAVAGLALAALALASITDGLARALIALAGALVLLAAAAQVWRDRPWALWVAACVPLTGAYLLV
jgi:hypothetical protein